MQINKILLVSIFVILSNMLYAQEKDPYIWLEELESEKSMNWVKEHNQISQKKLESFTGFEELKSKYLASYNDKDKIVYPSVVGDFVYNFWKDENNQRGIWRRMEKKAYLAKSSDWELILDLDELSKNEGKKWVFQGANFLQPDNTRCLLSLSDGGTDEHEVREFDVTKKEFVSDGFFLPSSKGSVAWISENELLISRDFGAGTLTQSGYPRMLKRIKRGEKIEDARLILEKPDTLMGVWASSDFVNGKQLVFAQVSKSFYEHEQLFLHENKLTILNLPLDADSYGMYQGKLIIRLNSDWTFDKEKLASGSLVSVDFKSLVYGTIKVQSIFRPNKRTTIDQVGLSQNGLVLHLLENVQSVLYRFQYSDNEWKSERIEAPALGQISILGFSDENNTFFYQYSNFITPPSLFYFDGKSSDLIFQLKPQFDATDLIVEQKEAKSADGTMIPYFMVRNKNVKMDGSNPCLAYAYGGFNVSIKPNYSSRIGIGWLAQGGIYVSANIRGGGEFGPDWHKAAMKEKRQNAYNDFYAVCEDLIAQKITSPKHLGAFGWSNGGLMAGVVATQRPDLFNAVIIGAPLLDMKRFNKMLAGASWMGEYGNPDLTEDWKFIQKYSPYHNLKAKKKYPEVLFFTSTKDDRVHPAHARKMAARMEEQGHPFLYYETLEGGHGAASTNDQSAFNEAMMFSYLLQKLKK